jgi:hypothetical protein
LIERDRALELPELARVRLDQFASFIVDAIGDSGRRARSSKNGKLGIFPGVGQRENRCKNEYLLGTATTQLELWTQKSITV